MAKNKRAIEEILKNLHWVCIGFSVRDAIEWAHSPLHNTHSRENALTRLRVALKTNAISMQIFQYFFDKFFDFSQWPLIFYISNINTSLYRFLLKFLNFVIYTSLQFLVRCEHIEFIKKPFAGPNGPKIKKIITGRAGPGRKNKPRAGPGRKN